MDLRDTITNIFSRICSYIPHLLILACFATIGLLYMMKNYNYLSKALVILIPCILLSMILIWKKSYIQNTSFTPKDIDNLCCIPLREATIGKIYTIFFFLTLGWMIFSQSRDFPFMIFAVLLFSISILHIFVKDLQHPLAVIFELFLTSTLFCASGVVCYPYTFIGTIDIMPHEIWTEAILNTGTIISSNLSEYGAFPLMHVGGAIIALLSSTIVYDSLYILTIGAILIGMPFVYLIAYHFTDSIRISLFSAFIYMMFGTLSSAVAVFPTGLYASAFIILLYLFLQNTLQFPIKLLLGVIVTTYMTQLHHATTLILIVVVGILIFSAFIYKIGLFKSSNIIFGFVTLGITGLYWICNYWNNIVSIVMSRLNLAFSNAHNSNPPSAEIITSVDTTPVISTTNEITSELIVGLKQEAIVHVANTGFPTYQINCIMSAFLIGFLLFGLYWILAKKNKTEKLVLIAPLVLLFTPFFIYGIAEVSTTMMNIFLIDRWRIFIRPFFALVMGVGVAVALLVISTISKKQWMACSVLVLSLIMLVIAGPIIHDVKDADIFTEKNIGVERYYLNENDLILRYFIEDRIPHGSELVVDYPYCYRYLSHPDYQKYDIPYYNANIGNSRFLSFFVTNTSLSLGEYMIFRYAAYESKDLVPYYGLNTGEVIRLFPTEAKISQYNKNVNTSSKLYDSGESLIIY